MCSLTGGLLCGLNKDWSLRWENWTCKGEKRETMTAHDWWIAITLGLTHHSQYNIYNKVTSVSFSYTPTHMHNIFNQYKAVQCHKSHFTFYCWHLTCRLKILWWYPYQRLCKHSLALTHSLNYKEVKKKKMLQCVIYE